MHSKLAGKPYAVVSFVESESYGEIILLKSKTRSFKEISDILKNPYKSKPPKSIKQHILSATTEPEKHKLRRLTGNLFSANQVLDMILDLAVNNPSLFNKFFISGQSMLEESAKHITDKPFLKKYFAALSKDFEKDLLTHITYSGKDDDRLKQIFLLVKQTVEDNVKNNTPLNKEQLKQKLVKIAKGTKL